MQSEIVLVNDVGNNAYDSDHWGWQPAYLREDIHDGVDLSGVLIPILICVKVVTKDQMIFGLNESLSSI
jgi:hypothetical protein